MSNAARQKAYRDRKRNAPVTPSVTRVTVTDERNSPHEVANVTGLMEELDAPDAVAEQRTNSGCKPTFTALPLDVQASIERMCNESSEIQPGLNVRERPGHSRQAMTERAINYQVRCGKR